eukprot:scaffold82319_cov41-Attheya_sp.AAC.1
MMKEWDDNYFTILDVAARIGSGVGSYGVDRYYILLKGQDGLLAEDEEDGTAIILDIKYEPQPAVASVLDKDDVAWFANLFSSEAERAIEAQRLLTSYGDPFTGWVKIDGEAFVVRQRSPWKDSFDLDDLTDLDDFKEFIQQVAIATATSHTRGTVAKSPGQFKHVIAAVLGKKSDRNLWGEAVARVALSYHQQVLRDFSCFQAHIQNQYKQINMLNSGGNNTKKGKQSKKAKKAKFAGNSTAGGKQKAAKNADNALNKQIKRLNSGGNNTKKGKWNKKAKKAKFAGNNTARRKQNKKARKAVWDKCPKHKPPSNFMCDASTLLSKCYYGKSCEISEGVCQRRKECACVLLTGETTDRLRLSTRGLSYVLQQLLFCVLRHRLLSSVADRTAKMKN